MAYCPKQGDVVWLSFTPQSGHEQVGFRPALTLSAESYNRKVGLALFCPITSKAKGYPFEVPLPAGLKASGVVLSDQVKSLDWQARGARYSCKAPATVVADVLSLLETLLTP